MSQSDFNIIVGVKLENAEKSIKDMIDEVGSSYPIQLKAVISNKTELSNEIKNIVSILNSVDNIHINIDNKDFKEAEQTAKNLTDELKTGMKQASQEGEKLSENMKEALNYYNLLKKTERDRGGVKTTTELTGNDYTTTSRKKTPSGKVLETTVVEDFKKLDKYIQNASSQMFELQKRGNLTNDEIIELSDSLRKLGSYKASGLTTFGFEESLERTQWLLTELSAKDKEIAEQKLNLQKATLLIDKERENWNRKINNLEEKGYTHWKQMESLKNMIIKLDISELDTLEKVQAQLALINKQYQKALEYQQKTSFGAKAVTKENKQAKKVNNLDENIVGAESIKRLNDEVKNISNATNMQQLEQSIQRVVKLYDELITKQKTSIELSKQEGKIKDIDYKVEKQLSDEQRIAEVRQRMINLEDFINSYKQRGVSLSATEKQQIEDEIKSINRLISEYKQLESEQERVERRTRLLEEKFESISYRSARGLNKNIKELTQVRKMIEEIQNEMNGLNGLSGKEFDNKYSEIEKSMLNLSRVSRELRDNARESENSFFGRFQHAMRQVPVWISAMTIFYGTMAQVRAGFQSLVEIDSAMINLQKVTEATNEEMENFKLTASEIGYNLGVTTAEVINATTEFQKLGYSIQQSSALAKNSILYANVGDMDVESATQSIISAVKGFDVAIDDSGKNVQKIVDIFNEVSNNFAISSEGIGQALQRSSAVLNQAGNSIEQSVALVTAANTTIQDPMKVGNALKTISMRLRGIGEDSKDSAKLVAELEGAFNRISNGQMSIMENEDTFKSTYDIMGMLAQQWDNLTDAQQAYMTELIGGKEQGSIVASMMQNWDDAIGSYETALNSAGSAQREFQAYTESFEYKINQLKVALEEFWVALIDDDMAKGFIDFLTQSVNLLTQLVELAGSEALVANFIGLIALFGSSTLRDLFLNFDKDKDKIDTFKGQLKGVGAEATGLIGIFSNLGLRTKGLGSLIGLFLKRLVPVIAVLTIIAEVSSGVIDFINKESNARKEKIKTLEDEIKKYETLKETMQDTNLDDYLAYEDRLNSGEKLNTDEYEEYKKLQADVIKQMPELVSYYNQQGEAVLRNADAIRKLIAQQDESYRKNNEILIETKIEETDFSELESEIDRINNMIKNSSFSSEETTAYTFAQNWINDNIEAIKNGERDINDALGELYQKFDSLISDENFNKSMIMDNLVQEVSMKIYNGNSDEALNYLDNYIVELNKRTVKLNDEIDTAKANISDKMNGFSVLLEDSVNNYMLQNGIDINSNEAKFIQQIQEKIEKDIVELGEDGVKDILKDFPKYIQESFDALEKANINVADLFTIDENTTEDSIKKVFDGAISAIQGMDLKNGQQLIDMLNELKGMKVEEFQGATDGVKGLSEAVTDVAQDLESAKDDIGFINGKLEEYKDNNKLSADSMLEIIDRFPTLIGYMNDEAGMIEQLKKLRQQDVDVARKQLAEKIEASEEYYNTNLKAIEDYFKEHFKFYEGDLTQFKNLAQAKADVESELIENLAKKWGVYYDEASKSFSKSPTEWTEINRSFFIPSLTPDKNVEEANKALEDARDRMNSIALDEIDLDLSNIGMSSSSKADKNKKSMQDAIYVSDEYAKTIDNLNSSIALLQARQERLAKGSNVYKKSLQNELQLTQKKKQAIDKEIKSLEKQIKTQNIKETGVISVGGEDNRTARARQAELQQRLDEARKELNALKVESEETKNRIQDLSFGIIEASAEIYKSSRDALSDDIAYAETSMELYSKNSSEYEKFALKKLGYLKEIEKYYASELSYLENEKKTNKNLTDADMENLNARIREAREAFYSASLASRDFQTSIDEIEIDKVIEKFDKVSKSYEDAIEDLNNKISLDLEEDDYAGIIDAYRQIIALTKGQVQTANQNITELNKLKNKYADNFELVDKITDEIEKWEEHIRNANTEVKSIGKDLRGVYETLADEFVDIYKEQLELMKQAEEEHYEDTMKKEEEAHDKRMQHLDDELEKLRKIYNDRLELIEREESARTYGNELEKMQNEAKELKKQIDELKIDDSYEAQADRTELERKLAELNMQIAEHQHDREIELRKQNLEDDLEAQEEALESKKDKYEEDYEKFVKNEEKKKEANEKNWEEMLNDERKFAKLREEIMNGNFDSMLSLLSEWSSDVSDEMSVLGESITNNFTDRVTDAIEALTSLRGLGIGSLDGSLEVTPQKPSSGSGSSKLSQSDFQLLAGKFLNDELTKYTTYNSQKTNLKNKAYDLADSARANGSILDPEKNIGYKDLFDDLSDEEKIIFAKYLRQNVMPTIQSPELKKAIKDITDSITSEARSSIGDDDYLYADSFLESLNKYLTGFSDGGYTGDFKSKEKLAKIHEQELILDKKNTKSLKQYLGTDNIGYKLMENLGVNKMSETFKETINMVKEYASHIANLTKPSDFTPVSSTENHYSVNVNIDRFNGNKKDSQIVGREIKRELNRKRGI